MNEFFAHNQPAMNIAHPPELIAQAVIFTHGHYVKIEDPLFVQHNLGPRFAQALTQGGKLSYAYLDLPGTNFDLITKLDVPVDLGSMEALLAAAAYPVTKLVALFHKSTGQHPTPQQIALALIKAKEEGLQDGDELGIRRLVKWVPEYERRAHWITTNRQLAYSKVNIDWSNIQ